MKGNLAKGCLFFTFEDEILSFDFPLFVSPSLCEYLPDIQRRSQREHETRKQDRRTRPLKLTVLTIVEIRHAELGEEEHGEDEVDGGKHHIVDHLLDLVGGVVPCALDSSGDVACSEGGSRHAEGDQKNEAERDDELSFAFHRFQPFQNKNDRRDKDFSAALSMRLRFCRGDVPFLPQIAPNGGAVGQVH